VRAEYEYEIPLKDADELLANTCTGQVIEKVRHRIEWDGLDWVIDEFQAQMKGLLLAEIELFFTDQDIDPPPWAGREVTGNADYSNEQLSLIEARDVGDTVSGGAPGRTFGDA
jgi:adenylate cyclase